MLARELRHKFSKKNEYSYTHTHTHTGGGDMNGVGHISLLLYTYVYKIHTLFFSIRTQKAHAHFFSLSLSGTHTHTHTHTYTHIGTLTEWDLSDSYSKRIFLNFFSRTGDMNCVGPISLLLYEKKENKKGLLGKGRKYYCSNGCGH
jgi:hypothetical protein